MHTIRPSQAPQSNRDQCRLGTRQRERTTGAGRARVTGARGANGDATRRGPGVAGVKGVHWHCCARFIIFWLTGRDV